MASIEELAEAHQSGRKSSTSSTAVKGHTSYDLHTSPRFHASLGPRTAPWALVRRATLGSAPLTEHTRRAAPRPTDESGGTLSRTFPTDCPLTLAREPCATT